MPVGGNRVGSFAPAGAQVKIADPSLVEVHVTSGLGGFVRQARRYRASGKKA